jgi:endonuclease YncB( thermonuclease family)
MMRVLIVAAAIAFVLASHALPASGGVGYPPSCVVERVIDGDSFHCVGGPSVSLLQVNAPEPGECGAAWATAALGGIFLRPGTQVRLEYDIERGDRYGRVFAAPIVTGTDGAEYNISIVMAYVGLARVSEPGTNVRYFEWARAAEAWARAADWNMWEPGGPFDGGVNCG